MAMTPGLVANLPAGQPIDDDDAALAGGVGDGVTVEIDDGDQDDLPIADADGNILEIEHPDGSITVSMDGRSLVDAPEAYNADWFRNLADEIDDMELGRIAEDLMRGVGDDLQSRQEWIEDRATGIRLLGLKIELPGVQGASDGAPIDGMSRVRHPLLLEAVLRFQANARSELLPTDGPVKIRNDSTNATLEQERLADAFERDFNHYLTVTDKQYYPDTDRMLFMLGFGGSSFKKVYFCPLRNRPVSESVDADDLIVNNAATDLTGAKRVTHRINMKPSTVKRMQILGVYRDTELSTPMQSEVDAVQREKAAQQGVTTDSMNPDDRDREIYECYCELDIQGFEHKWKGKPSGLEIPYRVTLDVSTKKVLSIVRNYDEDDAKLPTARQAFVDYHFVKGMGFYGIGLLHILGNTTNAITAAWRELLDSGMYANFPGFLFADTGGRQNTNIFRVPPGGGAPIKTNGMKLGDAIMALPYNSQAAPSLMALVANMAETGMRIGGTSEQQVGEGRADAPVGTTLAMIEQATKIMNSVHKRMHSAQADEFQMLKECFRENPNSFWERNRRPAYPWDEATFMAAVRDYDLVPQADPNTASHAQRVMKVMAIKQLQQANPMLYDAYAVDSAALRALGWNNPDQFFAPALMRNRPPPDVLAKTAELELKRQDSATRAKEVDGKLMADQAQLQLDQQKSQDDAQPDSNEAMLAQAKAHELEIKAADVHADAENRALERESREKVAMARIIQDALQNPEGLGAVQGLMTPDFVRDLQEGV